MFNETDKDRRIRELESRLARLEKTKAVLIREAERKMNAADSAFDLFKATTMLEKKVRERTAKLKKANERLENEIQERQTAQSQLKESLALKRATLESTADGIIVVDTQGRVLDYNQKSLELWKLTPELMTPSATRRRFNHIADQVVDSAAFLDKVMRLLMDPVQEVRDTIQVKDGRVFERLSVPYRMGGEPVGRVWSFRDITERSRAEIALRESEARYRAVLEANPDPVVVYDTQDRVVYCNPAFEETFGWSLSESQGRILDNFVPVDLEAADRASIDNLSTSGRFSGLESRRLTKGGESIPVCISGAAFRADDGHIAGRILTIRDVREKKRLETQLLYAQKMESIGTLAGGIAHDFNNLLTTIQGSVSMALFELSPESPLYELMRNIETAVRSGAKLTAQLLGYARKGRYEVRPLDLNHLVREIAATFGRTKKEIVIQYDLSPDLHAVEADRGQIDQALLNIFVNASQAMPGGGTLSLRTRNITEKNLQGRVYDPKPGNYIQLAIGDTGIGMDSETQAHIFEPFFTTKEMGRGTGLGLASAYGIIKGHGGYIDVRSAPGKGTTFELSLPATSKPVHPLSGPEDKIAGGGMETILLVDDEPMVLEVSAELLKRLAYTVITANDGKEAVEIYQAHMAHIDLVILDMIMPRMGGEEAFDRIRKINPQAKVLLSSGYSLESRARQILERGCNGFIQKPFNINDLSTKIREVLKRRG